MKTTPNLTRPAKQADPKIVKKARRDYAAYALFDKLSGEQDNDYLSYPAPNPHGTRPLDFGRPSR